MAADPRHAQDHGLLRTPEGSLQHLPFYLREGVLSQVAWERIGAGQPGHVEEPEDLGNSGQCSEHLKAACKSAAC